MLIYSDATLAQISIAILGSSKVGKSIFIKTFVGKRYFKYEATIEDSFHIQYQDKSSKSCIALDLIDTSGICPEICTSAILVADACILMYDVCRISSFLTLKDYYKMIVQHRKSLSILLVGNLVGPNSYKSELRQVTKEQGNELAKLLDCNFIETDCTNKDSINDCIQMLLSNIHEKLVAKERRFSVRRSFGMFKNVFATEKNNNVDTRIPMRLSKFKTLSFLKLPYDKSRDIRQHYQESLGSTDVSTQTLCPQAQEYLQAPPIGSLRFLRDECYEAYNSQLKSTNRPEKEISVIQGKKSNAHSKIEQLLSDLMDFQVDTTNKC